MQSERPVPVPLLFAFWVADFPPGKEVVPIALLRCSVFLSSEFPLGPDTLFSYWHGRLRTYTVVRPVAGFLKSSNAVFNPPTFKRPLAADFFSSFFSIKIRSALELFEFEIAARSSPRIVLPVSWMV